jgi:hypothetical protein
MYLPRFYDRNAIGETVLAPGSLALELALEAQSAASQQSTQAAFSGANPWPTNILPAF